MTDFDYPKTRPVNVWPQTNREIQSDRTRKFPRFSNLESWYFATSSHEDRPVVYEHEEEEGEKAGRKDRDGKKEKRKRRKTGDIDESESEDQAIDI